MSTAISPSGVLTRALDLAGTIGDDERAYATKEMSITLSSASKRESHERELINAPDGRPRALRDFRSRGVHTWIDTWLSKLFTIG